MNDNRLQKESYLSLHLMGTKLHIYSSLSGLFVDLRLYMHWIVLRAEIDTYHGLEPAVRVVILKALCDIRVEVLFLG